MARDFECLISDASGMRSRTNSRAGTIDLEAGVIVKAGATLGTLEPVADGDDVVVGVVPAFTQAGDPCVLIDCDAEVKAARITYPAAHKAWVYAGLKAIGIKVR
jgi:hypothetical protein